MLENLLQARRDISSAEEAKSWMPVAGTSGLSESLTNANFGQVAVEAIFARYELIPEVEDGELPTPAIPDKVTSALKAGNFNVALSEILDAISSNEIPRNDLARLYIEVLLLRESLH